MFPNRYAHRIATVLILGVMALGAAAPAADAGSRDRDRGRGHAHGRKYKDSHRDKHRSWRTEYRQDCGSSRGRNHSHRHYERDRVIIRDRGGNLGPALIGFVGGLIVGSTVSNHGHAHAGARYTYYDPYCERSYASLHAGIDHFSSCDHPRVFSQVEVRTQRVVKVFHYDDDRWLDCGRDWDDCGHSGYDRYDDGDYYYED